MPERLYCHLGSSARPFHRQNILAVIVVYGLALSTCPTMAQVMPAVTPAKKPLKKVAVWVKPGKQPSGMVLAYPRKSLVLASRELSVSRISKAVSAISVALPKGILSKSKANLLWKTPPKLGAKASLGKFPPRSEAMGTAWQAAAVEIVAAGRGRINYEAGVVKAIGLGAIAPPTIKKSRSQDILDARDAAFNDAVRSLSIAVSQVRVSADTRVSNYVLKNDDIRLRVETMVKNAEIVEEKVLPKSGVYRVVVQAKMTGPNSVLEAIDPEAAHSTTPAETKEPVNVFAPGAPAPDGAEYTSLIVDCRGLKINACMSPRLYDTEGQEVYGTMKISPDYVIETGIAAFPRSMSEARQCSRTGRNPLVVRAIGVADNNRFYPILRTHDAETIRAANQSSHFFERTAVVLLLDPER